MEVKTSFCIFNKEIGGPVRVQRDEHGFPSTYPTREHAEREIARSVVTRIFNLFDQEEGAVDSQPLSVRDYVLEVRVLENGAVVDPHGNEFGKD